MSIYCIFVGQHITRVRLLYTETYLCRYRLFAETQLHNSAIVSKVWKLWKSRCFSETYSQNHYMSLIF